MATVLIVEDDPNDLYAAAEMAEKLGFSTVEARNTASSGQAYLEAAIEKQVASPDVLILDLDLGYDSGHELLRFWHKNRHNLNARVVVWTKLGDEQQEICNLFKVDAVVSKLQGIEALRLAIKPMAAKAS
jgi:CheY-like chemotaxis protein